MRSNTRPALRLSTLRPHQIEMTPGRPFTVVCPDCRVWRRINRGKVQPHFLSDETTYCQASAQRVEKDVTPEQWALAIAEGVANTAARRPTTVLKKVKAPLPLALHQLRPAAPTADSARATYETHRDRCAGCTGTKHCKDGELLARRYLARLEDEPRRQRVAATLQRERDRFDRELAAELPQRRAKQWADRLPAVKDADNARRDSLVGARSPILAADVPTEDRNTQAQSQARAKERSLKALMADSPVRKRSAA